MSEQLLSFFSSNEDVRLDDATDDDPKLIWKVVLRTGTWKLRPGPGGVKLDAPLKVMRDKAPKGHISLSALKKAFDAKAKEFVTVPVVHADGTTADSGFVRKMAIQDVTGANGKTKESLLWAGMEITEPDVAGKIERKSLVGVSGGVLFDYKRTEDAKKFDQILSHVMVTNSPWINGTGGFETKLPDGVLAAEPDDLPMGELEFETEEEEIPPAPGLADPPGYTSEPDPGKKEQPAEGTVVWKPEEGYQFARGRVQKALEDWRRSLLSNERLGMTYSDFPYYSVDDISNGKALICSGYGHEREAWVADFKITDDGAEIDPFMNWTPAKQEWVAASEEQHPAPAAGRPKTPGGNAPPQEGDALRVAQQRRAERLRLGLSSPTPGGSMGKIADLLSGVELSDEQRAAIDREERETAERLSRLDNLELSEREAKVEKAVAKLDDLKLGDPGVKAYVRNIMLSDDGEQALNFSERTESGQRTEPRAMTATQIIEGFLDALPKNDEGHVALATQARKLPNDDPPPKDDETETTPEDAKKKVDDLAVTLSELGLEGLVPANANGGGN